MSNLSQEKRQRMIEFSEKGRAKHTDDMSRMTMSKEAIRIRNEAARCLLCHNPKCNGVCPHGIDIGRVIRALNFENKVGARRRLSKAHCCEHCNAPCMRACRRGSLDAPVRIRDVFCDLYAMHVDVPENRIDLSIDFCGVHCENPFFLSSSVVGSNYDMVAKALAMGWGGVCFKTISFLDIREASPRFAALAKEGNSFVGFKNIEQLSDHTYEENLGYLRRLKRDFPGKVIIASIMGRNEEEWTCLACDMEAAGVDMVECNFSCPQMVGEGLGAEIGESPELVARYTAAVRKGTKLPVLAKMTPNITHMEIPARAAVAAGADGIAAINTIRSIMNINLDTFLSEPRVNGQSIEGGYSGKAVKPIALRFINEMRKAPALAEVPISGMGGIENWRDAMEFLLMGCGNLQVTTAVMQYGYRIIEDLKEGLSDYLALRGFSRVQDVVGRALTYIVSPEDLDRGSIQYPRFVRKECIGCGRCYISCYDGGHQAIWLDAEDKPVLDVNRCVGCHLCLLVCPAQAIEPGKRVKKPVC